MRQVPPKSYLIVGLSRTAKHMAFYLRHLGHSVNQWHYRKTPECEKSGVSSDPQELKRLSEAADGVLLLIKDGALVEFLQTHPFLRQQKTVHFSGALQIEGVRNVHPLISFSIDLFEPEFYPQIPFALFTEENSEVQLTDVLPGVPNPFFKLNPQEKSLYHGLCVASGNLMVLLWQAVGREFQKHFYANPQPLLAPYLDSITRNLKTNWDQALTGPIARKDETTLNKNYVALKNTELREIFEAHVQRAWPTFAETHFKDKEEF